jgi:hypothetical protein
MQATQAKSPGLVLARDAFRLGDIGRFLSFFKI